MEKTVHIGCVLTESEYKRFTEIAERNGMYPSEAARYAINLYMRIAGGKNLDDNGIAELVKGNASHD